MFSQIYLSSEISRKLELRAYAEILKKAGYGISSNWVFQDEGEDRKEFRRYAERDVEDINCSDELVVFTSGDTKRSGHHVETGIAIGLDINVIVVGPLLNVFHYLEGVDHFDTVEEFMKAKQNEARWYNVVQSGRIH
jgi:hypothetical protein